jgi:hypothetical protein
MLAGEEKKRKREEERTETNEVEQPPKNVTDDDGDHNDEPILFDRNIGLPRTSSCYPTSTSYKAPWSAQELEFLHAQSLEEISVIEKYERFKLQCLRLNVPFRTFRAFETKLRRVSNK